MMRAHDVQWDRPRERDGVMREMKSSVQRAQGRVRVGRCTSRSRLVPFTINVGWELPSSDVAHCVGTHAPDPRDASMRVSIGVVPSLCPHDADASEDTAAQALLRSDPSLD